MMGRQAELRGPVPCVVDLEQRVPLSHELRRVKELVDFGFVRAEVAPFYGYNGNESVDPVVVMKLMFLLFWDGIEGERELMRQLPCRLDYLWFLDLNVDEEVPDHSVLSKARARWGEAVFEGLFVRTVRQCVEAGLVGGGKVHFDASLVDADASKDSVVKGPPSMIARLRELYAEQEAKLEATRGRRRPRGPRRRGEAGEAVEVTAPGAEEAQPEQTQQMQQMQRVVHLPVLDAPAAPAAPAAVQAPEAGEREADETEGRAQAGEAPVNERVLSTTDPDAAVARQRGSGKGGPRLRYMSHRAVDDRAGVVTAVATTPGDADEGKLLPELINRHEHNTGTEVEVEVAVADCKYGTVANYVACRAEGIATHMADLGKRLATSGPGGGRGGIYPDSAFAYDPATDTYTCPAGKALHKARHHEARQAYDYAPKGGTCDACPLKPDCTRAKGKGKGGRSVKRHYRQEVLDEARAQANSPAGRRDRRRRMHVMEGSFADAANNHHLKRSHWRRIWRQRIQDRLIAAVQNVKILVDRRGGPAADAARPPRRRHARVIAPRRGPHARRHGTRPLAPSRGMPCQRPLPRIILVPPLPERFGQQALVSWPGPGIPPRLLHLMAGPLLPIRSPDPARSNGVDSHHRR